MADVFNGIDFSLAQPARREPPASAKPSRPAPKPVVRPEIKTSDQTTIRRTEPTRAIKASSDSSQDEHPRWFLNPGQRAAITNIVRRARSVELASVAVGVTVDDIDKLGAYASIFRDWLRDAFAAAAHAGIDPDWRAAILQRVRSGEAPLDVAWQLGLNARGWDRVMRYDPRFARDVQRAERAKVADAGDDFSSRCKRLFEKAGGNI